MIFRVQGYSRQVLLDFFDRTWTRSHVEYSFLYVHHYATADGAVVDLSEVVV